jgi:hypothetical protein
MAAIRPPHPTLTIEIGGPYIIQIGGAYYLRHCGHVGNLDPGKLLGLRGCCCFGRCAAAIFKETDAPE